MTYFYYTCCGVIFIYTYYSLNDKDLQTRVIQSFLNAFIMFCILSMSFIFFQSLDKLLK